MSGGRIFRLGAIEGWASSAHRRRQRRGPTDGDAACARPSWQRRPGAVPVLHTLTRSKPPDCTGLEGRVDRVMLARQAWPSFTRPLCYVCGPTGFVETVAASLVALGHQPGRIKTERFGPTN